MLHLKELNQDAGRVFYGIQNHICIQDRYAQI